MIKATDLRVGNTVQVGTVEPMKITVETIHKDGINEKLILDEDYLDSDPFRDIWLFEDLSPVPLTTELIQQCGFEAVGKNEFIKQHAGYYLYKWHSDTNPFVVCAYINNQIISTQISTVNQLQNWHYAKTGEELELNLLQPA